MTKLNDIPVVVDYSQAHSGQKARHPLGFNVIKNGVKVGGCGPALPQGGSSTPSKRLPDWMRVKAPTSVRYQSVKSIVKQHRLSTVCEEAMCPNIGECWSAGTATIMIMGSVCTRACKFCAVDTGNPKGWLDPEEPQHAAEAVRLMGLKYVVITSVDRDDLPDGGAKHYADTVRAIQAACPETAIEALTPDFKGDHSAVEALVDTRLEVFAQNIETVKRLTHPVRDPRAGYQQTLDVLAHAKRYARSRDQALLTKTSLMLGLGETDEEIRQTLQDCRAHDIDVVTLGQYLRPTVHHLPVERFVSPENFARYRQWGLDMGFLEVVSGPLVRSSYRAEQALQKNNCGLDEPSGSHSDLDDKIDG